MTKIISAQVENFKRIEVVEITPQGEVVEITGKNEQGKSSVLDAIEAALGGRRHQPDEPIRRGTEQARVVLELDDLVVERVWSAKKSDRLVVKTRGGASFPKPQERLDSLVGKLAFDPPAFLALRPAEQRETLLRLIGVNLDELEERQRAAFEARRDAGRELKAAKARLAAAPEPVEGTPESEISLADLGEELRRAAEQRQANQGIRLNAERAQQVLATFREEYAEQARRIKELEEKLVQERSILEDLQEIGATTSEKAKEAKEAADALVDPDLEAIEKQISKAEMVNSEVRKARARRALQEEVKKLDKVHVGHDRTLNQIDAEKREKLAKATMPIDGLDISDDAVLYDSLPLSQASSSRRIRICTAIGAALNPHLSIALVRGGNDLDEETLAAFYEACRSAGVQAWVERIKPSVDSAIVIEAGRLANQDLSGVS